MLLAVLGGSTEEEVVPKNDCTAASTTLHQFSKTSLQWTAAGDCGASATLPGSKESSSEKKRASGGGSSSATVDAVALLTVAEEEKSVGSAFFLEEWPTMAVSTLSNMLGSTSMQEILPVPTAEDGLRKSSALEVGR